MKYVFRKGRFRDPKTDKPMPIPERDGLCTPMIHSDIDGYRSPIDGKWVDGRRARKYDMESNGCVEYEPPAGFEGRLKNPKFAKKLGLGVGAKASEAKKHV